ncbi:MAG: hypothetical protein V1875_04770 [Candidatus Altiarchaeota archaeon]
MLFGRSVFGQKKLERSGEPCPKCGSTAGMDVLIRRVSPVFFGIPLGQEIDYVMRCEKGHIAEPPDRDEKLGILRHLAKAKDDLKLFDKLRIDEGGNPIFDGADTGSTPEGGSKLGAHLVFAAVLIFLIVLGIFAYVYARGTTSEPTTTTLPLEGEPVAWEREFNFNLTLNGMTETDTEVYLNGKSIGTAKRGYLVHKADTLKPGKGYFKWTLEGVEYRSEFEILPEDLKLYGGLLRRIDAESLWEYRNDKVDGYFRAFTYNDAFLGEYADAMSSSCQPKTPECKAAAIYYNITHTFRHYPADRVPFYVQNAKKTILLEAGEYDDMNALILALYANSGIGTYVVSTENAAYVMACGIDERELRNSISKATKKANKDPPTQDNFALQPGLLQTINLGRSYEPSDALTIRATIDTTQPIKVYFASSKQQLTLILSGRSTSANCTFSGSGHLENECRIPGNGYLVVKNEGFNIAKIGYKLAIERESVSVTPEQLNITAYTVEGEKCVPADASFGQSGYVGLESEPDAAKILTDPATRDRFRLSTGMTWTQT